MGSSAPVGQKNPAPQLVHTPTPTSEYRPAAHALSDAVPAEAHE